MPEALRAFLAGNGGPRLLLSQRLLCEGLWRSLRLLPLFGIAGTLVCERIRLARGPCRCSHPHSLPRVGGSVGGFVLLRAQAFKWVHALLPAMRTNPSSVSCQVFNSHVLKVQQHVVQLHACQE